MDMSKFHRVNGIFDFAFKIQLQRDFKEDFRYTDNCNVKNILRF